MTKFTGTDKQIAYAAEIREALIKRATETGIVPADKLAGFVAMLDANASADAGKWIETAKALNTTGQVIGDNGHLNCDPRKFVPAICAK